MNTTFCDPTIPCKEIGKGFWWRKVGPGPLKILANPQLFWCAFTNYRLSWANHAIPLSMMSGQEFFVGLKSQYFPLFIAIGGIELLLL